MKRFKSVAQGLAARFEASVRARCPGINSMLNSALDFSPRALERLKTGAPVSFVLEETQAEDAEERVNAWYAVRMTSTIDVASQIEMLKANE